MAVAVILALTGFAECSDAAAPTRPTSVSEAAHPLGFPAPLTTPSTAYKIMHTNPDGSPVTYDPCRPIHYVTRTANQPADGPKLVKEAIAAISRATGLVFIDDGATTEAPGFTRKAFQPERYGDRWAPVLIAWAARSEDQQFIDGGDVGLGRSNSARQINGSAVNYVTGEVDLYAEGLSPFGDELTLSVLMHELGHVIGLDHEAGQVMDPGGRDPHEYKSEYQPGDLAGLAILGQGKCLRV